MSTTLDPRVVCHRGPAARPADEPASRSLPSREPSSRSAPPAGTPDTRAPADGEGGGGGVGVADGARHRLTRYLGADGSRWSLYLHATDGDEDWHLLRVDLEAPDEPAVDLTPLPRGSHVAAVDPLVTVPGRVLVTIDRPPGHADYVLVDVATGETTAHLPAGPAGDAESLVNGRC